MKYFLDTVDTIPDGLGFSHFDGTHILWLVFLLAVTIACSFWYRRLGAKGRGYWKKTVAFLLIADELFKVVMLLAGGNYEADYLPLHLCSINIFVITLHAFRPSKLLNNFLYTICIPATAAALLFPTWTRLPAANFMHIHSFTVHILLILYPIVLGVNGELNPQAKMIPKCFGLLICMAAVAFVFNLLFDTNFMFLTYAEEGNPLYWLAQNWGSHLWGFPVIIAGVILVMYVPMTILRRYKSKA